MLHYLCRHKKDYSRFNILQKMTQNLHIRNDLYILLPFSKNQFIKYFFNRKRIINDFFISNYDTYVNDRQKINKYNPRAWWKYIQDWINFRFSYYLLSDTQSHFDYWQELFGKFRGQHFVLPVLADTTLYYPSIENAKSRDKKKIIFYGSFIPLHGIEIILKAFYLLEKQSIPFDAEIIGNGQTFTSMKYLYDTLSLKNVKMSGEILSEIALANKIREADIVLGIFGHSKKAKSVIPNKVYQALACKKALITMRSNTIYEFFTDQEIYLCDNTPEALAEAIKQLTTNEQLLLKYSTEGYEKFLLLYRNTQNKFRAFLTRIDECINANISTKDML